MKVNEVRPESKVDVIELTIREKGAAREFSSRGGSTGKVCDAKGVDREEKRVRNGERFHDEDRRQEQDEVRRGGDEPGPAATSAEGRERIDPGHPEEHGDHDARIADDEQSEGKAEESLGVRGDALSLIRTQAE